MDDRHARGWSGSRELGHRRREDHVLPKWSPHINAARNNLAAVLDLFAIRHNAEFNTTSHVTLGPSCKPGLTSPRDESADPCPLSAAHCFDLSRSTSHFSVRSDLSLHSCRPFLQDAGSGPRKSGSCWVRQLHCDLYVVPWPGVWRIVSGPFEQNLLFVPFWPQAPPFCIWQPMGFGR